MVESLFKNFLSPFTSSWFGQPQKKPVTPVSPSISPLGSFQQSLSKQVSPLNSFQQSLTRTKAPTAPMSKAPIYGMSTPTGPVTFNQTKFTPSATPRVDSSIPPLGSFDAGAGGLTLSGGAYDKFRDALNVGDREGDTEMKAPDIDPATLKAVRDAESAILAASKISPEELSTQRDLDRLIDATKKAYVGTQDKTIPLEFITGQLASIENRALGLAEPLESKLARLQASRLSSLESSKFALERADERLKTETERVAEANKLGDPFTLGEGQVRFDAKGNIVARGPEEQVAPVDSAEVTAWTGLIGSGKAKFSDVPEELQGSVARQLASEPGGASPQAQRAVGQADTALTNIDRAIGLISEVPFGALGRAWGSVLPGSDARDLARAVDTVKALIGFDQLQKMREASPTGGALGQVSERELNFLQTVAGSLDIGQSTKTLMENLDAIRESFETLRLVNSPDGTVFDLDGVPYVKSGDELIPQADFKGVGGDTNSALNLPQRNNNPGNIKAGGLADKLATGTDRQGHLIFPDAQTGFLALTQDLNVKISGNSRVVSANPTIAGLGKVYAEDPKWSNAVAKILGVSTNTKLADVDFNSLLYAIARQEGFYA